jgi:predicted DNA-binding transcriptional regulator AlpA
MSSFLTANYLDISETKFLQDVNAGKYPQPIHDGRRVLWDRHQIDAAVDRQFGAERHQAIVKPLAVKLREMRR